VDQRSMRMLWSKSAIWEMDVGLITTLLQRFKLVNIVLQRLSLELTIILLLTCGVLLALFSKWSLEISYLNHARVITMTRMMITWLK
jgi:hypothetical protein